MFGSDDQHHQQAGDSPESASGASLPMPSTSIAPDSSTVMTDDSATTSVDSAASAYLADDDDDAPSASTGRHGMDEAAGGSDLLSIKQQALKELSPLVGHLNQTPEEKFRTTMMMIQAADDESLIKTAYEAAQNIADEKVRAQALLDIVNEINYFTQHHEN